jgi:hypothetical protein
MSRIPSHHDKKKNKQKAISIDLKNIKQAVMQAIDEKRGDPEMEHFGFSLLYINQDNYNGCDWDDKLALIDSLNTLSQLTWKQVHTLDRHKLGFETIPRKDLRFPIPAGIGQDVRFSVFRFSGMKPMIGFRRSGVFFILWLDYDFSAYDHE